MGTVAAGSSVCKAVGTWKCNISSFHVYEQWEKSSGAGRQEVQKPSWEEQDYCQWCVDSCNTTVLRNCLSVANLIHRIRRKRQQKEWHRNTYRPKTSVRHLSSLFLKLPIMKILLVKIPVLHSPSHERDFFLFLILNPYCLHCSSHYDE